MVMLHWVKGRLVYCVANGTMFERGEREDTRELMPGSGSIRIIRVLLNISYCITIVRLTHLKATAFSTGG